MDQDIPSFLYSAENTKLGKSPPVSDCQREINISIKNQASFSSFLGFTAHKHTILMPSHQRHFQPAGSCCQ